MLAATLYGPMDLKMEEREIPTPQPDEVIVKVSTSGLCPTDVKTYRHGSSSARYPVILGHEVSGTIESVGDYAGTYRRGMEVNVAADAFCGTCRMCTAGLENLCTAPLSLGFNVDGTHADYIKVPGRFIANGGIFPLNGMDNEMGSMLEPVACSLHSLNIMGGKSIRSLAVIGDGPMAMLHVIVARKLGIEQIVMIGLIDWKLDLAEKLGVSTVIQASNTDPVHTVRQAYADGVEAVAVTVVTRSTMLQAVKMASRRGCVNIFAGVPSDQMPLDADTNAIHYGELTLTGSSGYTYDEYRNGMNMAASSEAAMKSIITHRFSLNELRKAIDCWDDKNKSLKILISH